MKRTNRDPWDILNISKNATMEEVKTAFRSAAMRTHPDRGGDMNEFRLVNEAFNKIKSGNIVPIVHGPKTKLINLPLSISQQINGVQDYIELSNGEVVYAKIPAGALVDEKFKVYSDKQNYILNIKEGKDKVFTRDGFHVILNLCVSIEEAILGTKKVIEGPTGDDLEIIIPSGSQPGDIVVLNSLGLYNRKRKFRGHLKVRLLFEVPSITTQAELEEFIKRLKNVRNR